ncbi:MAG: gliding motility-associated C-terminal domain-containing protein [Vicingaceae bacterium]
MKKIIANIVLAFLLLSGGGTFAQINLDQQVIGTTGGFSTGSSMTLSATVGEAVVQSLFSVNTILTQGFQQPLSTTVVNPTDSTITAEVINATCTNGGSIFIDTVANCPKNSNGSYSVLITSTNNTTPLNADSLAVGTYRVVVTGNGCSSTTTITIELDDLVNCELKFYSGITPNGDGKNDVWKIDNISLFPNNKVHIFNRWGAEVWSGEGYDNSNVVWKGLDNNGDEMPDATYFYVVTINDELHKGWVEITR